MSILSLKRGSLCLHGPLVDAVAASYISQLSSFFPASFLVPALEARLGRDGTFFHITVIPKCELSRSSVESAPESYVTDAQGNPLWSDVGLGHLRTKNGESLFISICWPNGLKLRQLFQLDPYYDFHITLGFIGLDDHSMPCISTDMLLVGPAILPPNRGLLSSTSLLVPGLPEKWFKIWKLVQGYLIELITPGAASMVAAKSVHHDILKYLLGVILTLAALQPKDIKANVVTELATSKAYLLNLAGYHALSLRELFDCLESVDPTVKIKTWLRIGDFLRKVEPFSCLSFRAYWKSLLLLECSEVATVEEEKLRPNLVKKLIQVLRRRRSLAWNEWRKDELDAITISQDDPDLEYIRTLLQKKTRYLTLAEKTSYSILLQGLAKECISVELDNSLIDLKQSRTFVDFDGVNNQQMYKLPRNFSWVIPFALMGMSTPRNQHDILALAELGVTKIVTLTKEEPLPNSWFEGPSCDNLFLPVENYQPPSLEQVEIFIWHVLFENTTRAGVTLVHCGGGKGRAGTCLAAYLVRFGFSPLPLLCNACVKQPNPIANCILQDSSCALYPTAPCLDVDQVLAILRDIRPGSVETKDQEKFLKIYVAELWKRHQTIQAFTTAPPFTSLSKSGLEIIASKKLKKIKTIGEARVVVLVGLPGCGKSWLAAGLKKQGWEVISQDDLSGSKSAFEDALGVISKKTTTKVVIDRCNPTKQDRQRLFELMFNPTQAIVVYFKVDAQVCQFRVKQRLQHPTIPVGRGDSAIAHFVKIMQVPVLDQEPWFDYLCQVSTFKDVEELLSRLSGPSAAAAAGGGATTTATVRLSDFTKYPRTLHWCNFGAATFDDLVLDAKDLKAWSSLDDQLVSLEEKVDGANLGISLVGMELRVQNRSHYVNSASHAQFSALNRWLELNSADLRQIIKDERWILYGEWMVMKHSVYYNALPDYFIAFDLYDRTMGKFLSRAKFHQRLNGSSIHPISTVAIDIAGGGATKGGEGVKKIISNPTLLKQLLENTRSNYIVAPEETRIEGVVVRFDKGDWLVNKAKVVRADFIAGQDAKHWTKLKMTKNKVIGHF